MGLFGHMCIHESGTDRSLDTPTPSNLTHTSSPCSPTKFSPTDTDVTTPHSSPSFSCPTSTAPATAAPASVAQDIITDIPDTTTGITPATSDFRGEDQEYTWPYCDRPFTSRIGLVGHRTETGEPVPGAAIYTHFTRLNCPHCPRTFTHCMGLFERADFTAASTPTWV
ncbi:hypothetical protein SprV_0401400500 [Sparganum proliferum]